MPLHAFKEKWGIWAKFEGDIINVKSKHLYRRWRPSFEHDVSTLKDTFEIKYHVN